MPLTGTESILAANMFVLVTAELGAPPNPQASKQLKALCSGLAKAIVPHIVSMAQVQPGQLTAGTPAAQVTTTPGIIM